MNDMLALALAYGLLIALLLGHSLLTARRIQDLDARLQAAIGSINDQSNTTILTDEDAAKAREAPPSDDE